MLAGASGLDMVMLVVAADEGVMPQTVLPSGKRVGIVDVPGHEKFIKNMLAGASGLDMVMLVVAADEGVMPQTVEHIDILSFLNIKNGLIVLTKSDMVEP